MAFTVTTFKAIRMQTVSAGSRLPRAVSGGFTAAGKRFQSRRRDLELSKWAVGAMSEMWTSEDGFGRNKRASQRWLQKQVTKDCSHPAPIRPKVAAKMTKVARFRNSLEKPENIHNIYSVGELNKKLFHHGEDIRSIICFKDIWCRAWGQLEEKVKRSARVSSNVQFLVLDVSDRNSDLFDYFKKNSQAIVPHCLVYDSDIKVSEGRWGEIWSKILEKF